MSGTKQRRHFTGQEKVAILRRHLLEKVPVSDLCEEHGIHPTLFYRWQKDWFEQGAVVFDTPRAGNGSGKRSEDAAAQRIAALQDKLRRKDEVLSELMEEHVALKKSLGEV
jgi:transposase-like protein